MLKFAAFLFGSRGWLLLIVSLAIGFGVRAVAAEIATEIATEKADGIVDGKKVEPVVVNGSNLDLKMADTLVSQALEKKLDENLQWLRLIHYQKTWLGWESEADNALFFIAKDGRKNPRSELIETIRAGVANSMLPVAMPGAVAMTARCQYPARWKWILKELNMPLIKLPLEGCTRYFEFLTRQSPVSVTFVFSGFYVDNPSSSFGHVLLRLNRMDHADHSSPGAELLDHGVGYAANATTRNPILYAIGGFGGWFPSTFSSLPFYYKVREYSDAESRDLWEYDLNLLPDEVERLTDHLWELGSTYFYYYYLKQNCAYHLLALIEAAAPRVHLRERMPFYVIPVDTVKAITEEPGLVGRVVYRPSTARVLKARISDLTTAERDLFFAIRNEVNPALAVGDLDKKSAARVLDAVLDDIDYHHFRELVFKTAPEAAARKQSVLLARANLPAGGEIKVDVTDADRPDRSHGSGRWWIAGGTQTSFASLAVPERIGNDQRSILDGEVRFAIHDALDPLDGYLPYSSVEFWRMRGRYDLRTNRVDLQSFSLFTITSLNPIGRLEAKPAWRVNIGLDRVRDQRCDNCLAPTGHFFAGVSLEPRNGLLVYGLGGPRGETSPEFMREKWLASFGMLGGVRLKFSKQWQIDSEIEWRRVFDRETFDRNSGKISLRWDHRTNDLRRPIAIEAELAYEPAGQDALMRFIRYF